MKKKDPPRRRRYTKPEVRRVELTPEESLAVGCKNPTASGSLLALCNDPAMCSAMGS